MGLRGGKIHRVGNDTTQVSRGVAKCIKEAKTEKDAMDILEGGLVHMNQTLAEEKNTGTKPSRGEWPAIVTAAHLGYMGVMRQMLELGVADPDEVNSSGMTSAIVAANAGNSEILKFLYEVGANMEKADENGQTPLFVAVARGHLECTNFLLGTAQINPNLGDIHGATPLYMASAEGDINMVNLLLEYGPSQVRSITSGATPLHVAVEGSHMAVVHALLKSAPELVNVMCDDGLTPLHIACSNGNLGIVSMILKVNKNGINASTKMGIRPLHYAAKNGYEDIVCDLLYFGADPNAKTTSGLTPMMLAITNGRRNTACILKDAGSTIVLPYILRNLFLLSCFSISFLFMWPGLLTRTSQYRLVIALVLFSGGILGYYAHFWHFIKKYQGERGAMNDILLSNDTHISCDMKSSWVETSKHVRLSSSMGTVLLTPRESPRSGNRTRTFPQISPGSTPDIYDDDE